MAVILVRHAMPDLQPDVAAQLWRLSDAGREDCVLLARALPELLGPVVYSSSEPKAAETAAIVAMRRGLQTAVDVRLGEVDRPPVWVEDHRARAMTYLGGDEPEGWEPRSSVVARFASAVDDALTNSAGGDVVIVNHGMALSLWLASVLEIDVAPWWRALTLPDAWRVDVVAGTLERVFAGGRVG